jgi:hypothetical protein
MKKVSVRTLALLLELLLAVVSHQYLSVTKAHAADAVWLAGNGTVIQQGQPVQTDCAAG